jgi:hypothetical protein
MARKKKEEAAPIEQNEQPVELETKPVDEPIYLRETLMEMDEIKQFGLNKYFLRAILKNKFYTLEQAKSLIQSKM